MKADLPEKKFNSRWKENLEDVNSLPNAVLQNKEASWEKLHARLGEKSRQKNIVWYWLAAACLIFAIMIFMFIMRQPVTSLANNNYKNDTLKKPLVKKDEPVKNVVTETPTINAQHLPQKNIVVKNQEKKSVPIDTSLNITPLAINNNNDSQNQFITIPTTIDTSGIAAVSSVPVQKKLKVVHVNELGEPVEFNADIAHSTDLHLFQLKLAQQEIYNASTIASNNGSFVHFLTK